MLIYFAQAVSRGENSGDLTLWNIHLTLSCVWTVVNGFVSNLVWCKTLLNSTVWFQFEWPWCTLKVARLWESQNLCSHSVEKLHEATQMFVMVGFVRGMNWKKPFNLLDTMRHFRGFAGLPWCATFMALHVPLRALQMQMRELYDQSEYLLWFCPCFFCSSRRRNLFLDRFFTRRVCCRKQFNYTPLF